VLMSSLGAIGETEEEKALAMEANLVVPIMVRDSRFMSSNDLCNHSHFFSILKIRIPKVLYLTLLLVINAQKPQSTLETLAARRCSPYSNPGNEE
jgi:hypothetical protein